MKYNVEKTRNIFLHENLSVILISTLQRQSASIVYNIISAAQVRRKFYMSEIVQYVVRITNIAIM